MLSNYIKHLRDREYMSGTERDQARVKATGEVFTPTELVQEILDQLPQELFTDSTRTFLDPACGDGQFLSEILIRRLENGIDFETALSTIYGVDLMIDNVDLCRERLLCGSADPKHTAIVEKNIYQADGLKFSYDFCPMSNTRRAREEKLRRQLKKAQQTAHFDNLFKTADEKKKPKKK